MRRSGGELRRRGGELRRRGGELRRRFGHNVKGEENGNDGDDSEFHGCEFFSGNLGRET